MLQWLPNCTWQKSNDFFLQPHGLHEALHPLPYKEKNACALIINLLSSENEASYYNVVKSRFISIKVL